MARLREILLTQYIGAVMIGLVLAQGVTAFINTIVQSGAQYWIAQHSRSAIGNTTDFPWSTLITSLVRVSLYVVFCLGLIRWLYAGLNADISDNPADDGQAEI
ncbi:MAG TPA: hypothetical protein VHQ22_04440 [Terriglobales bacterium]|jgi:hypothetical protein|nr:hypothetical protein [Terriglobales bacterium]